MRRERCAEVLEGTSETEEISRRVVVSADKLGREFLQHVKRFVCQPRTTDDANRIAPAIVRHFIETLRDVTNSFIPRCRNQLAALLVTDHRRANARFVIDERMCEPTLNAQKLAVDT